MGLRWRRDDKGGAKPVNSLAAEGVRAGGRRWKRRTRMPALRDFSQVVLQVETAARRARGHRAVRSCADAASLAARDAARSGQQDPLPAAALPLRSWPHRGVLVSLPPSHDRGVLGASHPDAARHAAAPGESETPTARQALVAL